MDKPALRTIHWNARGLRNKVALLRPLLQEQDIDVALISETLLGPADKIKFPGYLAYRQDERSEHGAYRGLVVLVKRRIVHQPIPPVILSSMYALGIELLVAGKPLRLFAAYRPPVKQFELADVHKLLDSPLPTIIAGDWNCKHAAWNSTTANPQGRKLLHDSEASDYMVSGPDAPTHYPPNPAHREDVLDIAVYRGLHYQPLQEVLLDELGSDHQPVLMILAAPPTRAGTAAPRRRIDWTAFTEYMDNDTPTRPVNTAADVELLAEELTERMQSALERAKTTRPGGRKTEELPQRLKDMILAKRRMRKRWQETRCPLLKRRLNILTDKTKAELVGYTTESWERYLEEAAEGWPAMHRVCRQLSRAPAPTRPLLHSDGTPRYRAADRAEILAAHLERQFQPNPTADAEHTATVEQHLGEYLAQAVAPDEDPVVFSPGEVQHEIRRAKPRKAPGADEIPNMALRRLPHRTVAALTRLFNGILRSGTFPQIWKTANVIMLPKQGKNPLRPESYRPISLLPTQSKVFERLLLRHLTPHIVPRTEQFGFRAEHSTTQQLSRVLHTMTVAHNKKEFTAAVFLDMEKAFDRVWHAGLLYKLARSQTPRRLVKVVHSFLEERRFRVVVEDTRSEERPIAAGVPQGSCLSPVLYVHFTDDIPLETGSQLALYADDAAYFATSIRREHAAAKLQKSLDALPEWLSRWRLSVNVGKTQALLVGQYIRTPPPLKLQGQDIPWSPVAKYLGITIDARLTMRPHVKHVVAQTKVAAHMLRPVLNSPRIPLRLKLGVFKTYVRTRLTYAAPAWYALPSRSSKTTLRAQQQKALRTITNAPRYVRNTTIQRDLRIESLDDFIQGLAKKMFARADESSLEHIRGLAPLHARPPDRKALPRDLVAPGDDVGADATTTEPPT